MVAITCCKYKDIVCLVSVNKLNITLFRSCFDKNIDVLEQTFYIIVVSVDNHICNRYVSMCCVFYSV